MEKMLQVYRTDYAPEAKAVLTVSYEEFPARYSEIHALLSPTALEEFVPAFELEVGLPLGPGLRSVVRITSGLVQYERVPSTVKYMEQLRFFIIGGAVERNDQGKMVAFLETEAPLRSLQELNEMLGITSVELVSDDNTVSVDPERPTEFRYAGTVKFPAGMEMPALFGQPKSVMPRNLTFEITAIARGILTERRFWGRYETRGRVLEFPFSMELSGPFEIYLA